MNFFTIALFVICAGFARSEVKFQGYMVTAERSLFVLSVDHEKTSGWLPIGQSFDGFILWAFDSKADLLTVEKDGNRQALRLVQGKVQSTDETLSQFATKRIVISIAGQERISVGGDSAALDALKVKMTLVAAMVPQPVISLYAPRDTEESSVRAILETLQGAGVKRVSFDTVTEPNKAPDHL